jgi:predicted transcriptional regulator
VIAVAGNPLDDVARLQKVDFVMKAGKVYKQDGRPAASVAQASQGAEGADLAGF